MRKALVLVTDFEGEAMAHSGGVPEFGDGHSGYFWGPELGGIGIPWAEKGKWWWQAPALSGEGVAERILFDDIPLTPYYKVNKARAQWPYLEEEGAGMRHGGERVR